MNNAGQKLWLPVRMAGRVLCRTPSGNQRVGCTYVSRPRWPRNNRRPLLPVGMWKLSRRRAGLGGKAVLWGQGKMPAASRGASPLPQLSTWPSRHQLLPWKPTPAPGGLWGLAGKRRPGCLGMGPDPLRGGPAGLRSSTSTAREQGARCCGAVGLRAWHCGGPSRVGHLAAEGPVGLRAWQEPREPQGISCGK